MLTSVQLASVTPEMNLRNSAQARKPASKNSTLVLKPRADITRSLKQGYQWPMKITASLNLIPLIFCHHSNEEMTKVKITDSNINKKRYHKILWPSKWNRQGKNSTVITPDLSLFNLDREEVSFLT